MYYTVYKITHKETNREYIGSHVTENLDDEYMGSGYHIRSAVKKYGTDSFAKEILHIFDNKDDMLKKEAELVTEEFVNGNSYNIVVGGRIGSHGIGDQNPFFGKKHSEETRKLMSEKAKTRERKPHSEETKRKISEKAKGRDLRKKHSDETRRKMSETHKKNYSEGKRHYTPKYGTENPFYGKKHSEEALRKNREKTLGKKWVNNGVNRKQVTVEELSTYLSDGWVRGRGSW